MTASVLADLMTEAYVDNVTWYDVMFLATMTSRNPAWSRWPPVKLSGQLGYVGVAVRRDFEAVRAMFHRTHLDIFGDAWPHSFSTGTDAARYVSD